MKKKKINKEIPFIKKNRIKKKKIYSTTNSFKTVIKSQMDIKLIAHHL